MQTVQPCVTIGSYIWAQDRLPYDEFTLRLDALRAAMERNGWPAVLVYGDVREHAALAFLSSFIPRVRWGMALLPRTGDARLLCAMSTRDLPAMRTLTWIADVRSGMGPEWEKAFDPWVESSKAIRGKNSAPLVSTSWRRCCTPRYAAASAIGSRCNVPTMLSLLPSRRKRPRELTMIRASCELLKTAAKTFAESWRGNHEPETAALDAERVARSLAAQDVRTLVSLDGGRTLVPFQGRFEKMRRTAGRLSSPSKLWAIGPTCSSPSMTAPSRDAARHAEAALDAIIATMRPGARANALHAKAVGALRAVYASSGPRWQRRPRHRPVAARRTRIRRRRKMQRWWKTASIHCRSVLPTPKPAML